MRISQYFLVSASLVSFSCNDGETPSNGPDDAVRGVILMICLDAAIKSAGFEHWGQTGFREHTHEQSEFTTTMKNHIIVNLFRAIFSAIL